MLPLAVRPIRPPERRRLVAVGRPPHGCRTFPLSEFIAIKIYWSDVVLFVEHELSVICGRNFGRYSAQPATKLPVTATPGQGLRAESGLSGSPKDCSGVHRASVSLCGEGLH